MPAHHAYLLHIYRSRAVSGWQWAARLDALTEGTQVRFSDPAALLAHLQTLLVRVEERAAPTDTQAGADGPVPSVQDGGSGDGG